VSLQPYILYRQGNCICSDSFSRETFLVSKNFCLQVGQLEKFGLHVLQMLWPPRQKVMGDTMYCLQAGHSSSVRTLLSMSDTAVSMMIVTRFSWTRGEKRHLPEIQQFDQYNSTALLPHSDTSRFLSHIRTTEFFLRFLRGCVEPPNYGYVAETYADRRLNPSLDAKTSRHVEAIADRG